MRTLGDEALESGGRRPNRSIRIAAFWMVMGSAGCMPPLSGTLGPIEKAGLRRDAVAEMVKAADSDDTLLRMQAIEALQEVAPREGLPYIVRDLDHPSARVCFAALMAVGSLKQTACIDKVRLRSESGEASVRAAALYALHRMGVQSRTGELAELLMKNEDPRVRANAALAISRLGEPSSIKLLLRALRREQTRQREQSVRAAAEDLPRLQMLEALAMLKNESAIERLMFSGYSAYPDQAAVALMSLANARCAAAEELFRFRLYSADHPEIRLQAARALGRLGYDHGFDIAVRHLWFNSPREYGPEDPPAQQVIRTRGLAALALEAINRPDSLKPLRAAFDLSGQSAYVRLAIARAAISIIDSHGAGRSPPARGTPDRSAQRLAGLPAIEPTGAGGD